MTGRFIRCKMNNANNKIPHESFNADFCVRLEYHLCRAFENSQDEKLRGFWCDGVAMPFVESQLTKKSVNDTRKIVTKAWLGYNGQSEFEMTIHFGRHSLRRYARGADLGDCLPDFNSFDWIALDIDGRTIELMLN